MVVKAFDMSKAFQYFLARAGREKQKRMAVSFLFLFWCVKTLGFVFHLENTERETLPV